jgi:hypothetical protein
MARSIVAHFISGGWRGFSRDCGDLFSLVCFMRDSLNATLRIWSALGRLPAISPAARIRRRISAARIRTYHTHTRKSSAREAGVHTPFRRERGAIRRINNSCNYRAFWSNYFGNARQWRRLGVANYCKQFPARPRTILRVIESCLSLAPSVH